MTLPPQKNMPVMPLFITGVDFIVLVILQLIIARGVATWWGMGGGRLPPTLKIRTEEKNLEGKEGVKDRKKRETRKRMERERRKKEGKEEKKGRKREKKEKREKEGKERKKRKGTVLMEI